MTKKIIITFAILAAIAAVAPVSAENTLALNMPTLGSWTDAGRYNQGFFGNEADKEDLKGRLTLLALSGGPYIGTNMGMVMFGPNLGLGLFDFDAGFIWYPGFERNALKPGYTQQDSVGIWGFYAGANLTYAHRHFIWSTGGGGVIDRPGPKHEKQTDLRPYAQTRVDLRVYTDSEGIIITCLRLGYRADIFKGSRAPMFGPFKSDGKVFLAHGLFFGLTIMGDIGPAAPKPASKSASKPAATPATFTPKPPPTPAPTPEPTPAAEEQGYTIDEMKNMIRDGQDIRGKKIYAIEQITFETGSHELTKEAKTYLNQIVDMMTANEQMTVRVNGHADNTGDPEFNRDLSRSRARAVHDYLRSKNISQPRLSYEYFGADKPISDNSTEEGRTKNRRVEFEIVNQ